MEQKFSINEMSKEEILETLSELLKASGFKQYRFHGEDQRIRYLPDMFIKDALKYESFQCDFYTKGLDPDHPEKMETLTIRINLKGEDARNYFTSYHATDPAFNVVGETILEQFQQYSKKPFKMIRLLLAMLLHKR